MFFSSHPLLVHVYSGANLLRVGRTGYGAHGDYLFGWEGDSLQRAMDALNTNCWSETCPALKLQSWEKMNACTKKQQVKEEIDPHACTFKS